MKLCDLDGGVAFSVKGESESRTYVKIGSDWLGGGTCQILDCQDGGGYYMNKDSEVLPLCKVSEVIESLCK